MAWADMIGWDSLIVRFDFRMTGNHEGCPYGALRDLAMREDVVAWG